MKKTMSILFVTMIGIVALAEPSFFQGTQKDDFEKMTFDVELNKDSYLLLEPIFVEFKFSNQTKTEQTTYNPSYIHDAKLKVSFRGKISVFEQLSAISGVAVRFPATVPPKWISTGDEMLNSTSVGVYFPEPGNYKLQFVLHSWGGNKTIESNVIDITIENPTGLNKEASDFMRQHRDFFGQSFWIPDGEKSERLLETFVNKYGQSVYAELAINSLGSVYLSKGELDEAKLEFEKIKNSEHKIIAEDAKRSLSTIEKRKADLENSKHQ